MKSVIMVGGGIQQAVAVKRIQSLGFKVIVTDKNEDAPAFKDADYCLVIDGNDVRSLITWILVNKEKLNIQGIFTLTNLAQYVAIVANAVGLPSLPVDIVIASDNKLLMKNSFLKNKIPSARFSVVEKIEDIEAFLKSINGNCYLKVPDSFGGKGIVKICHGEDFVDKYQQLLAQTKLKLLIIEEEMLGSYIDAQGFFVDGRFYPAGIADSFFSNNIEEYKNFNPVEILNVAPSQQPEKIISKTYELLEKACKNLGMEWGPVGGDFILVGEEVMVVEVGPRLHGPNATLQIFPAATGQKAFEFMIQLVTNSKLDFSCLDVKYNKVAVCNVFISKSNTIKSVSFSPEINKISEVFCKYIYWNNKKTQTTTSLSGLATVYLVADNYHKVMDALNLVKKVFVIDDK